MSRKFFPWKMSFKWKIKLKGCYSIKCKLILAMYLIYCMTKEIWNPWKILQAYTVKGKTSSRNWAKKYLSLQNVPDEFIDLKEVTHALSKESSLTHENIVMGSISNDSRNSSKFCYPSAGWLEISTRCWLFFTNKNNNDF